MLATATLQAIVWTSRMATAEQFYTGVLGLRIKGRSHGATVFDVGGQELRLSPVSSTRPSEHTVLGFRVANVRSTIASLGKRGLRFERFPGWPHDEMGALTTPEGATVAWFRDPDGNLLSLVQYA